MEETNINLILSLSKQLKIFFLNVNLLTNINRSLVMR